MLKYLMKLAKGTVYRSECYDELPDLGFTKEVMLRTYDAARLYQWAEDRYVLICSVGDESLWTEDADLYMNTETGLLYLKDEVRNVYDRFYELHDRYPDFEKYLDWLLDKHALELVSTID